MQTRFCIDSPSAEHTRALGAELGSLLVGGDVIGLSGPLGAGKTCLVQGVALGLDVDPSVPVTSPTFTLVGEYPGRLTLRHADFYRVETYGRLEALGFDDLLEPDGVLLVEWPERFPEALPAEHIQIQIELLEASPGGGEPARRLSFGGRGLRADEIKKTVAGS
jgi:tRNA threonylcarbamoyladenosine biosynthesis protein TsaE